MSNSFDPDQARYFVESDLDRNCLQRLSDIVADNTRRLRVNRASSSVNILLINKKFTQKQLTLIMLNRIQLVLRTV